MQSRFCRAPPPDLIPPWKWANQNFESTPDRLRAAEAGLSNSDIGYTVDAFIDSAYADKYILDGEEIDLALVMKRDTSSSQKLEDVPIPTPDGAIVPAFHDGRHRAVVQSGKYPSDQTVSVP